MHISFINVFHIKHVSASGVVTNRYVVRIFKMAFLFHKIDGLSNRNESLGTCCCGDGQSFVVMQQLNKPFLLQMKTQALLLLRRFMLFFKWHASCGKRKLKHTTKGFRAYDELTCGMQKLL